MAARFAECSDELIQNAGPVPYCHRAPINEHALRYLLSRKLDFYFNFTAVKIGSLTILFILILSIFTIFHGNR